MYAIAFALLYLVCLVLACDSTCDDNLVEIKHLSHRLAEVLLAFNPLLVQPNAREVCFRGTAARTNTRAACQRAKSRHLSTSSRMCSSAADSTASRRYLILRHGETNFNADGILQGSSDVSRLTEKGEAQASKAGMELATLRDLLVEQVFVSPLSRATSTLELVAQSLPYSLPEAIILPELREVDLYSWEGRLKEDLKREQPDTYKAWQTAPMDFAVDGHYPAVEMWQRAKKAWAAIRASEHQLDTDGVTLIVCHNGIGQALFFSAIGLDASHFRKLPFPNAGALECDWPLGALHASRWRWRLPLVEAGSEWRSATAASLDTGEGR